MTANLVAGLCNLSSMAKKKTTKAKAAPGGKKPKGRGGRKPGQWLHLEQDQLKAYRKDAKLSRARLAELLDVSSTSIQNWETGRSVPVKRYQERLVELMTGTPPAPAPARAGRGAVRADGDGPVGHAGAGSDHLQATRLSVAGEILKGYLATAQGGKLSTDALIELVGSLRRALH